MILFLKAQDIKEIEIGLAKDQSLFFASKAEAFPEEYLGVIDRVLSEQGVRKEDISKVYVVTGPGSFTASRVITLIANAFQFAKQVPVIGVENKEGKTMHELFEHLNDSDAHTDESFVLPTYDRPPRITKPGS